jgi:NTP pyrophosphatase (non-canonical NTP hydrolase)
MEVDPIDHELLRAQITAMTKAMTAAVDALRELASSHENGGNTYTAGAITVVADTLDTARATKYRPPYNAFEAYRAEARRTRNRSGRLTDQQHLANMAMGLAGEAGEVVDLLKKDLFHGKPADAERVEDELGDVLWYLDGLAEYFCLSLQEVADGNVAKLKARYPDGFKLGGGNRG